MAKLVNTKYQIGKASCVRRIATILLCRVEYVGTSPVECMQHVITFVSGSTSRTKRKAVARKRERRRNVPAVPGNLPQLEPSKSGVATAMVKFPIQLAAVVMDTAVPVTYNIHTGPVNGSKLHSYWKCIELYFKKLASDI